MTTFGTNDMHDFTETLLKVCGISTLYTCSVTFVIFPGGCPRYWNRMKNGSCWRVFDKVQMTWQAAHTFCLQQDGRLASWTDVQVINETSPFLNDTRRYWINSTQSKVYLPHDPLQNWYWLDGEQFNASHRRGLYGELSYTVSGEEETCAMIRDNKKHTWEDSSCDTRRSFICKKGTSANTGPGKMVGNGKLLRFQLLFLPFHCFCVAFRVIGSTWPNNVNCSSP